MMTSNLARLSRVSLLSGLAGMVCFAAPLVRADEGDAPTRVARISYLDGSVSFQPAGDSEWGSAVRNRPMTIGDKIWVDKDSRAELQAGQASIHLASMTALSFLNLDENTTQMRLAEGTINFRVRELRDGDLYEVDAPNLAFTVRQAGAFRIDVAENGDATRVTLIRGEGEVTAGGKTYRIHAGERGEFEGTEDVRYSITTAPGPDGFDRWAQDRDLKGDHSASARYVSRDVPGYDDLDDYGNWDVVPDYGPVWYPTVVSAGWAPYSWGYWNWVGPWGWTWIDYYPWGFAPFHYGRWAFVGGRWGWCPGPYYVRPVYGPAFVGFIGGSNFSFGFGFGSGVGWFPLGPREPFFPWWHCSRTFITNINIRNTRIVNVNVFNSGGFHNFDYRYARNVNAVTGASRSAFVGGHMINRGEVHVNEASLRRAEVTNRAGFSPTRQSFQGSAGMRGRVSTPPSAIQDRPVMARTSPGRGASGIPVRTMDPSNLRPAREGFDRPGRGLENRPPAGASRFPVMGRNAETAAAANNGRFSQRANAGPMTARDRELAADKPQFSGRQAGPRAGGNNSRAWEAQGNTTDRGRAPANFGRSDAPPNSIHSDLARAPRMNSADRTPWAGGDRSTRGAGNIPDARGPSRGNSPGFADRPQSSNEGRAGNRSFESPQRNNQFRDRPPEFSGRANMPERTYNPPQRNPEFRDRSQEFGNRGFSQQRSYSPPQSSYPSPSYSSPRSYSAPSRSYSEPRGYSAPRSYPAPGGGYSAPRSNSAPSRGSYGGGSSNRGGGGDSSSGGTRGNGASRGRH